MAMAYYLNLLYAAVGSDLRSRGERAKTRLPAINKRDRRIWKGAALQLKAASETMEGDSSSEVKQAGECRNVVLLFFLNC
jgi:hypothetical protein